jgi:hypothetical protein
LVKEFKGWHWELKKIKQRNLPIYLWKYVKVFDDGTIIIEKEDRGIMENSKL